MEQVSEEGERLLLEFGKAVVVAFDHSLNFTRRKLTELDNRPARQLRAFLKEYHGEQRSLLIAQKILETCLHQLMVSLDDSEIIGIYGRTLNGELVNLKSFAMGEGLRTSFIDWLETLAEHGDLDDRLPDLPYDA